jgi:hypothetical protein
VNSRTESIKSQEHFDHFLGYSPRFLTGTILNLLYIIMYMYEQNHIQGKAQYRQNFLPKKFGDIGTFGDIVDKQIDLRN